MEAFTKGADVDSLLELSSMDLASIRLAAWFGSAMRFGYDL